MSISVFFFFFFFFLVKKVRPCCIPLHYIIHSQVAQCFRSKAEDPWITVVDHMPLITHESDSDFLWCEANYSGGKGRRSLFL